jgi:hypothetical protein
MADCDVSCTFCGYAASAEEAAALYIADNFGTHYFDPKEEDEHPLHRCPNCENLALVYEEGYTESDGICFACGDTPSPGEYVSCDQCQELCSPSDRYGGMCPDCLQLT